MPGALGNDGLYRIPMNNPVDSDDRHENNPSVRRKPRGKIFGERVAISVRVNPATFKMMKELCTIRQIAANTYINQLIEADLDKLPKKRKR
jgi:hypothetical protein